MVLIYVCSYCQTLLFGALAAAAKSGGNVRYRQYQMATLQNQHEDPVLLPTTTGSQAGQVKLEKGENRA
nr:hypothetical protein Iba_chr10bCG5620 [Ipomoea batatas]